MRYWSRWLRDAIAPQGTPVYLVAIIAFLISMIASIYLRSLSWVGEIDDASDQWGEGPSSGGFYWFQN
jgi:hypothetical protein